MTDVSDGLPSGDVDDLHLAADGRFWAATAAGLAVSVGDQGFATLSLVGAAALTVVRTLPDGRALAGGPDGLWVVETSRYARGFTYLDGLPGAAVSDIQPNDDNTAWIATNGGLTRFVGEPLPCGGEHLLPAACAEHAFVGMCATGARGTCDDSVISCVSDVEPTDEAPTRIDDDCDGEVDEGFDDWFDVLRLASPGASISLPSTGMGVLGGDFTFEFWLRPHDEFPSEDYWAVLFASNGGASAFFRVEYNPGTQTVGAGIGDSVGSCYTAEQGFSLDGPGWHHVALVRQSGVVSIFIDGSLGRSWSTIWADCQCPGPTSCVRGDGPSNLADGLSAPPVDLMNIRFSSTARYSDAFAPTAAGLPIDASTVAQWVSLTAFDGETLIDEAGGDNSSLSLNNCATTRF